MVSNHTTMCTTRYHHNVLYLGSRFSARVRTGIRVFEASDWLADS